MLCSVPAVVIVTVAVWVALFVPTFVVGAWAVIVPGIATKTVSIAVSMANTARALANRKQLGWKRLGWAEGEATASGQKRDGNETSWSGPWGVPNRSRNPKDCLPTQLDN